MTRLRTEYKIMKELKNTALKEAEKESNESQGESSLL